MLKGASVLIVGVIFILLLGCSSKDRQRVGVVAGAVTGGLLGSAIGGGTGKAVAIGVGAVAGAILGNEMASYIDAEDEEKIADTMDHHATSQPAYWANKATGGKYMMVPESQIFAYQGHQHCRRYASTGYVHGRKRHVHGVICKQDDGKWQVVRH